MPRLETAPPTSLAVRPFVPHGARARVAPEPVDTSGAVHAWLTPAPGCI